MTTVDQSSPSERFTALHQAHAESVYRYAWSLCRDALRAEDLLQEIMVKVATNLDSVEQAEAPRAVILRWTRNLVIDHLRKERTRNAVEEQWGEECLGEAAEAQVGGQSAGQSRSDEWFLSKKDGLLASYSSAQLSQALAALPDPQRSIIHLHLWEGMSFREISEIHQIPLQTAASRYRYGLGRLQSLLSASPLVPVKNTAHRPTLANHRSE